MDDFTNSLFQSCGLRLGLVNSLNYQGRECTEILDLAATAYFKDELDG